MELCDLCVKLRVLCGCAFLVAAVLRWDIHTHNTAKL